MHGSVRAARLGRGVVALEQSILEFVAGHVGHAISPHSRTNAQTRGPSDAPLNSRRDSRHFIIPHSTFPQSSPFNFAINWRRAWSMCHRAVSSVEPIDAAPGARFYSDCMPEFGAYKVLAGSRDRVEVRVWMPCAVGVGSPGRIDDLRIEWNWYTLPMVWAEGDWRLPPGPHFHAAGSLLSEFLYAAFAPVPHRRPTPARGAATQALKRRGSGTSAPWSDASSLSIHHFLASSASR